TPRRSGTRPDKAGGRECRTRPFAPRVEDWRRHRWMCYDALIMNTATRMTWMLLLVATALPFSITAAEAPVPAEATIQPMDRARIAAMKPWQLRQEMDRVEQRFYALYNKLSTQDEFDIVCTMQAQPNSKFKRRTCRPRFLFKASNADAQAFLD